tara:strand:- start:217 stop:420 length:204 start_codon:yes stop_codon:yes gene_type:complete
MELKNIKKEIYKDLMEYMSLDYVVGQNNYDEMSSADQEKVQKVMEEVESELVKKAGGKRSLFESWGA